MGFKTGAVLPDRHSSSRSPARAPAGDVGRVRAGEAAVVDESVRIAIGETSRRWAASVCLSRAKSSARRTPRAPLLSHPAPHGLVSDMTRFLFGQTLTVWPKKS